MKRDWAALVFAMVFPTVMAWVYFVALGRPAGEGTEGNLALQGAYAGSKVLQFSFPVLWVGISERRLLRPARPSLRGVAAGLAFGLFVGVAMVWLYHAALHRHLVAAGTPEKLRGKVAEFGAATPAGFVLLAVFIAGVHSLLEEYYWRWFVFGGLKRHTSVATALTLSSLAFMAHHVVVLNVYLPGRFLSATVPFALCIAAGGAAWACLYERTDSIYAPWLSHLVIDVAIMAVGYDLVFGSRP